MGAILGFLNFNTYPARVFLGDAGSQFLGFSIAIFSILLTETVHTALNPALPLFLVGLPLLDTIWVFGLRLSQGRSPFRGDRQHIHHQLLMCGLSHSGAVSVIYLMQAVFIGSALLLTYQSDIVVVGVFCIESIVFLALVLWAKSIAGNGNANESKLVGRGQYNQFTMKLSVPDWFRVAAGHFTEIGLSLFLVLGVFLSAPPTKGTALACLAVAALLAFAAVFLRSWSYLFTRIGVYVSSLVAIFSYSQHYERSSLSALLLSFYLGLLILSIVLCVRQERRLQFRVVPQDLLIVFFALAAPLLPNELFGNSPVGFLVISAVILFYICEYLISFTEHRHRILRVCTFLALVIYGIKGLVI